MASSSFVQTTFHGGEFSQAMQGRMEDPRYKTALNVCLNAFPTEEGNWVRRPGTRFIQALPGPGKVVPFAFPNAAPYALVFTDGLLGFLALGALTTQTLGTQYGLNTANDWSSIRVVQAENTAVLLNGSQPQTLSVKTLPTAIAPAFFNALSVSDFQDGPYLDIPTDNTLLTPSAKVGSITITLSGGSGQVSFKPTDPGRHVRIQSIPPIWNNSTTYHGGDQVFYAGNVYKFLDPSAGGANSDHNPPVVTPSQYFATTTPPGFYGWQLIPAAAIWSWGTITAVASPVSATMTVRGPALLYTNATPYFRLGVYSNTTGWPTCGCYHEGRLWLSGAIDNRVDASMSAVPLPDATYGALVSQTNPIFIFSPTDVFGTVGESNAIAATFLSEETNAIFWLFGDQQGIICGTRGGEWLIQATSANLPLTPTSIQAHRYTKVKCANVLPMRCNLTIAFVQVYQRKVMEYFSDVFSGRMTSPNLSETAKHLMINSIVELAYQQEKDPVLWARDGAGNLLGCTYKRESLFSRDKPTIAAWHHHTLGSGRTVTSICTAGNSTGQLDSLVMVTTDGATYWLEVLGDTPDETESDASQFDYLDASSLVTTYTDNGLAGTLTITGLSYLAGRTVTIWAGGLDVGDYTIANDGTVTVGYGDGVNTGPNGLTNFTGTTRPGGGAYLLTSAYVQSFSPTRMPIYVGFVYPSEGQLCRPVTPQDTGARNGPGFSKKRREAGAGLLVVNTQGLEIGTSFTLNLQMFPVNFRDPTETLLAPNQLYSGVHWVDSLGDDYSFDGMLAWRVTRPYPVTIAAVGGFVQTQDR